MPGEDVLANEGQQVLAGHTSIITTVSLLARERHFKCCPTSGIYLSDKEGCLSVSKLNDHSFALTERKREKKPTDT